MTHFIFDCDDVLLNWMDAFKNYLPSVGFFPDKSGPHTWEMAEWLGTTKPYARKLMNYFNHTPAFADLAACEGARETVWRLREEGHTCAVLSACGDDRKVVDARYHNVHMRFDTKFSRAFDRISCLPLGASKHQWLAREGKRGIPVVLVEDNFQHALSGVTAGIKTYCVRKPHNRLDERGNSGSGVIWINNIGEVTA